VTRRCQICSKSRRLHRTRDGRYVCEDCGSTVITDSPPPYRQRASCARAQDLPGPHPGAPAERRELPMRLRGTLVAIVVRAPRDLHIEHGGTNLDDDAEITRLYAWSFGSGHQIDELDQPVAITYGLGGHERFPAVVEADVVRGEHSHGDLPELGVSGEDNRSDRVGQLRDRGARPPSVFLANLDARPPRSRSCSAGGRPW
jgi:hypothetical protein